MSALSFLRRVPFSSSFPCPQGHIGPGTEFGFTLPSTNLKEPLEALSQASGHHSVCVRISAPGAAKNITCALVLSAATVGVKFFPFYSVLEISCRCVSLMTLTEGRAEKGLGKCM